MGAAGEKRAAAIAEAALSTAQAQLEIDQALASGDEDEALRLKAIRDYWQEVTDLMAKGVGLIDAETVATQNLDLANAKLAQDDAAAAAKTPAKDGKIHGSKRHLGMDGSEIADPAYDHADGTHHDTSTKTQTTDFAKATKPSIDTKPDPAWEKTFAGANQMRESAQKMHESGVLADKAANLFNQASHGLKGAADMMGDNVKSLIDIVKKQQSQISTLKSQVEAMRTT